MTTPTTPQQARDTAFGLENGVTFALISAPDALRSLAKQVEALTAEVLLKAEYCRTTSSAHEAACAERDALKPDAELYRHLRDHFAKTATDAKAEFARLEPLTGDAFDAVVRASMDAMGVEA